MVYNLSYGTLADPKLMLTEFHGHTKQVGGVGVTLELAGFYALEPK